MQPHFSLMFTTQQSKNIFKAGRENYLVKEKRKKKKKKKYRNHKKALVGRREKQKQEDELLQNFMYT